MNPMDLPYYKIFNKEERLAARCSQPYRCEICDDIIFYCDVMNLRDVIPLTMVCGICRIKHRTSFEEKREKHFASQNKQSTN